MMNSPEGTAEGGRRWPVVPAALPPASLELCILFVVAASCGGGGSSAIPTVEGVFIDPTGDAVGAAPQYDITTVRTVRTGPAGGSTFDNLRVEITLAQTPILAPPAGNLVGNEVVGFVEFDTDLNATTGDTTGVHKFFCEGTDVGVEFTIYLGARDANGDYAIYDDNFNPTGQVVTPTVVDNTLVLNIPLSRFGGDDGATDMVMVLGNEANPTDCAPDAAPGYPTSLNVAVRKSTW